ncbi:serine/threonine-protein phosphatase Pgam5, mitochondrial isoform X1 [Bactrocera neohumeralis]|uniref:serine/threonine-protein phosphatase Pgam5, mitochondrial isoform X1 n=1 Tax=Bactrocera tryoni TaxID=59916 RepID=UPI001A99C8AF|nr:serine/threonine-protein phosphatase Pgam5, mitochondrial isoform X1 [Bactrocera tryoni]XP_050328726.1 serine/threonine-protein phosphatase Pgam5, mitochondrial isoform X1 [Bactrocera neohumeralis]XP_050328727.1 serine/threonine-protein phosphatase Pgam5, mitochondrial isoform X1 [Bactrocera neohumeralis]
MATLKNLRIISSIVVGTGAGLSAYYYQLLREPENLVQNSLPVYSTPVSEGALWDTNWDFREPKSCVRPVKNASPQEENRYNNELEKMRVKATRHIVLIRHGQYLDNGKHDKDHHLTELGKLQAKYTGQRLHELGIKWDKIIVSTMTRAQETSEMILKEIEYDPEKVRHCPYLREGAPIAPQPPISHWRPEKFQHFFQDGARIEAAFRRYFHRAAPDQEHDSHTLIIGHANVIRYFVCRALQLPPEAWLRININHGSITWLTIRPSGNVSIHHLGETGYMPANVISHRIPREAKNVV